MLVLYAFVTYLLNQDKVSDKDFRRRIRIVTNLVYNSEEEIDKNENTNKNSERILNAFKIVNQIILEGVVDNKISPGFNQYQIDEEKEKLEWTQKNPDKEDGLFELEDNYRLYGQIGIVGLENYHHFKKFIDLFYCYYVHVDCALLTKGNYFQIRNQLYQGGSLMFRSWQSLFHRDYHNEGFENTKKILNELLDEEEKFTTLSVKEKILSIGDTITLNIRSSDRNVTVAFIGRILKINLTKCLFVGLQIIYLQKHISLF